MTNRPTYPIILTDPGGYLDLIDNEDGLTDSNVLGLIKEVQKNFQAYDKDGFLWRVSEIDSNYRINALTKLLAYTVYNPIIKVSLTWTKIGGYKLDELKKDICNQTDRDDDVITQFSDGEVIKEKVKECDSFDDLIRILNKYIFKVDEKS